MKTLIVEDDFTSRTLLHELLQGYGPCHIAVNGKEAVKAVAAALQEHQPYDLICLDILMPEMDGQQALERIRADEEARGISSANSVKIVMTTALPDPKNVDKAFYNLCDAYLVKPIDRDQLVKTLQKLHLVEPTRGRSDPRL